MPVTTLLISVEDSDDIGLTENIESTKMLTARLLLSNFVSNIRQAIAKLPSTTGKSLTKSAASSSKQDFK